MKKICNLFCVAALAFSGTAAVLPAEYAVFAAGEEPATSGSFYSYSDFTWEFDAASGTLKIDGTGIMPEPIIELGGSVDLWYYILYYRDQIKHISISDSVTGISSFAFYQLIALESVEIPDQITKINEQAFCNCTALKNVQLPKNLISLGEDVFYNTPWLAAKLESADANGLVIEGDVLLNAAQAKGTVTVPGTVRVVADSAFCSSYIFDEETAADKIIFEEGVEYIGANLFLTAIASEVEFPASVKRIDSYEDENNAGWEFGMFPFWVSDEEAEGGEDDYPAYRLHREHLITIRSMDCEIADYCNTLGYSFSGDFTFLAYLQSEAGLTEEEIKQQWIGDYSNITIRAYEGSTAEAYAKKYGYKFESLGEAPQQPEEQNPLAPTLRGDADCSENVDVSDAVLLARYLAADTNIVISSQGKANADADASGTLDSDDVIYILRIIAMLV